MSFRILPGKLSALLGAGLLLSIAARADGPPVPPSTDNPFVVVMVILILILALAIGLLANVLLGAAQLAVEKDKAASGTDAAAPTALILAILVSAPLLFANPVRAQGGAAATQAQGGTATAQAKGGTVAAGQAQGGMVNGVSDTSFYMITGVIFLEVVVLLTLLYNVKLLIAIQKNTRTVPEAALEPAGAPAVPRVGWWEKFNRLRPVEQEIDLDLGHDYDGIRELDNKLPPWWLYGFYCTILFACIYLWRYHVSHSAPSSSEEYQIAVRDAEVLKAAYLKNAAANVDEISVKLLTGGEDLEAGKAVFLTTCWACHGKSGEGGVGPNLTDAYWLHGGSIQEIFKTIKYGWPEKGMKSWKDDYSPTQIAQIASYVKSLGGTKPANPKPPQGAISPEGAISK